MADRRTTRSTWLIAAAVALAILGGIGYWIFSVNTQPSLVSDEGADLVTPEELDAEQGEAGGN